METKVQLRSRFQSLRHEFGGREKRRERESADRALKDNLRRLLVDLNQPDLQVCLYRARGDEALCEWIPLTDYFFPRLNGDEMEFFRPSGPSAFSANQWGIQEPIPEQSAGLNFQAPVLVCCPAVAVDREGHRLGMGRAYYDRFFTAHPRAGRVGVIYHFQLAAQTLPHDAWDMPLDWLVTDKMILDIQTRSPKSWM